MTIVVKGIRRPSGTGIEVELPERDDGSIAGIKVVKHVFDTNTPDLNVGVPVYYPKAGEFLYDAWFRAQEPWSEGQANLGQYLSGVDGLFSPAVDLSLEPNPYAGGPEMLADSTWALGKSGSAAGPAVFADEAPLKLVVSYDGMLNGAPVGATIGSTTLYLMIL